MFKKLRFPATVAGLMTAGAAFAEGEGSGGIDVTAATGALTQMETAVKGYFTSATPIVVGLIGLGLVIVLCFVGWKLIKRATNKAG